MRVEVLDSNKKWIPVIEEALLILDRVKLNTGQFSYISQVANKLFNMSIRPMKDELVNGQPLAHQYVEIFEIVGNYKAATKTKTYKTGETPIFRLHFE